MADPFDYASFKELASELIEAAGESAVLKKGTKVGRGRGCKTIYERELVRKAWGEPEVMTEQTIASGDREDFVPIGESGVQATNLGMFAWYTEGDTQTLIMTTNDSINAYKKTRTNNNQWGAFSVYNNIKNNANRAREPLPLPIIVNINYNANYNVETWNLPPISYPREDKVDTTGILIDDATGQSLYYCNNKLTPPRCEHYRRAIYYQGHDPVAIKVVESEHNIEQRISSNEGVSVDEDLRGFIVSAAAGVVPEIDDIIVLASDEECEIGITDVQPLKPGGTTILYEVMGQV